MTIHAWIFPQSAVTHKVRRERDVNSLIGNDRMKVSRKSLLSSTGWFLITPHQGIFGLVLSIGTRRTSSSVRAKSARACVRTHAHTGMYEYDRTYTWAGS